ncbi:MULTISPECIES: 3D domain-containing protein [unclassified Enterococcus]|uniref:3D domain-containing protein n=1 Tax=unclassified Enterococcus TaxID=2608891 RepID=UPI00201B436D|nr:MULTISPECIES: 3D domain-containing protein [unclassified Enterococcus]
MKFKSGLMIVLASLLVSPASAFAESVEDINQKTQEVQSENAELSNNLNAVFDEVNNTYQQVESIKAELETATAQQEKNKQAIEQTQNDIKNRKALMNEQLRELQVSQTAGNSFSSLLNSANLSDFIRRTVALSTLREAQNDKVEELNQSEAKLKTLIAQQDALQATLLKSQAEYETQAVNLNQQVENLTAKVSENDALISSLASSKAAEEKLAADQAKQVALAAQASQSSESSSSVAGGTASQSSEPASSSSANHAANNEEQTNTDNGSGGSNSSGAALQMSSTAYSYAQPGMGYITATGINLKDNPNVIAVDPSVIPLGSLVQVSGYGYAIAGDTGGAIKGNIIDVHFPTEAQCTSWGRKSVTVTILS